MGERIPGVNTADPGDDELFARWQTLYNNALATMRKTAGQPGALIEVAAQHPLREGRYPGVEFSARLGAAIELYRHLQAEGVAPLYVYVPGSVHLAGEKPEEVSLARAGTEYLLARGIDPDVIFGDDANARYKGEAGVYNSSDECYVAAQLFFDLNLGQIHCVCSPAQLMRKALSYVAFGLVPAMHSVPVESMFHSYVDEAFCYIPRLLTDSTGLQGDSIEAERLRAERKPQH